MVLLKEKAVTLQDIPQRLEVHLSMLSTAEVTHTPPFIDSGCLDEGPEDVDVWLIGLEISGREKDSLMHREEAFTNLSEVWRGGVQPRHCEGRGSDSEGSGDRGSNNDIGQCGRV